jgi:Protein  of unknown function (DUF3018)
VKSANPPRPRTRKPVARTRRAKPKSSREKVNAFRERMRSRGMKLVQLWVPDPGSPHFRGEASRQARALATSPHEKDEQEFIDSVADWDWK